MGNYEIGSQPCKDFNPMDELFEGSGNAHQCLLGHCVKTDETVSFCNNCYTDHHSGGWDNHWRHKNVPIGGWPEYACSAEIKNK